MIEYRRNPFIESHALNRVLLDQGRHPGRILVIAHRGASVEAPENTLAAIERAIAVGADAIEFDIRSTFDDKLVLMHDERVDRTTDGHGAVSGMTLRSIRELDAGYWFSAQFKGERVPRFGDAIDLLAKSESVPVIELKDRLDEARSAAPAVVKVLRNFRIADRAVVIARDPRQIARVKELSPWTATALVTFSRREAEKAVGGPVDGLVSFWPSLTPGIIRKAHDTGEFVAAWTVTPERMQEVARYGVDALITDDPRAGLDLVRGRNGTA